MANSAVVGTLKVILGLDTAEFERGTKEADRALKGWAKDFQSIGQQATAIGGTLTKSLTLPILALGAGVAKVGMEFETAFADVRKTVGGTKEEMAALEKTLRNMSKTMPSTTTELAKIAAMGGQMGVSADNMGQFVYHVAALGTAVDGISVEEAASGLAQIGNVAGVGTSQIAQMSSALVHLGNNSVSTEGEILEFSKRLMGAGTAVGLTIPEVMALGTAMADVGINAEAGGTAMSTVLAKMSKAVSTGGEDLREFAKVAGVSADAFASKFKSSPIEAVDLFVKGLARIKREGGDLNLTMGEVGTEGIRVASTLKLLAGATNGVEKNLRTANEGFRDANKHIIEFDEKNKTTAASLKILWNQIRDVGLVLWESLKPAVESIIGLVRVTLPMVESLAKGFAALPGPVQLGALGFLAVAAAAGPLLLLFGQMAFAAAQLTTAFTAQGIATRVLGTHTATLTTAMGFLAKSIAVVGTAMAGWAIGTLVRDMGAMGDAAETAGQRVDRLGMMALTWGERVEAVATQVSGLLRGEFLHGDDIMKTIVSRRMAMEHMGQAATTAGEQIETAATRSKASQDALKKSSEDLALQIDNLKKSGTPAAQAVELLGAQAAETKKQARLLGVDLATLPPTVLSLADAYSKTQVKSGGLNLSLEQQKKALKEAEKALKAAEEAAKDEERAIEALDASVKKLGFITIRDVNRQLAEMQSGLAGAAASGVGVTRALPAFHDQLQILIAKAKASGLEVGHLVAMLDALRGQLGRPANMTASMDFLAVRDGLKFLSMDASKAKIDADRITEAYHAFGLKTPQELDAVARKAREHYQNLRDSGTATTDQLSEAWEDVLEAEKRGRKDSVSVWKQWGKQILGIGQDAVRGLAASLLGMSGATAQEHDRLADEAEKSYEDTVVSAQEAFNETSASAQESYDEQVAAAHDAYNEIVEKNETRLAEMKADESVTEQEIIAATKEAHEQQREAAKERDRKLKEAHDKFLGEVKSAEDTMNGEIEASHQEMLDAKERASHRWKDNLKDIWRDIKESFKSMLVDMLSSFIMDFLGGMIKGIITANLGKWLGQSLSSWVNWVTPGAGGSGIPGASAGGGVAGGGALAQVGTTILVFEAIFDLMGTDKGLIDGIFDPLWTPDPTTEEQRQAILDYFGPNSTQYQDFLNANGVPQFSQGTHGQYLDFGSGTLAMLHGREKITPQGADVSNSDGWGGGRSGDVHVYMNGKEWYRLTAPDMVDVFREMQLTRA